MNVKQFEEPLQRKHNETSSESSEEDLVGEQEQSDGVEMEVVTRRRPKSNAAPDNIHDDEDYIEVTEQEEETNVDSQPALEVNTSGQPVSCDERNHSSSNAEPEVNHEAKQVQGVGAR